MKRYLALLLVIVLGITLIACNPTGNNGDDTTQQPEESTAPQNDTTQPQNDTTVPEESTTSPEEITSDQPPEDTTGEQIPDVPPMDRTYPWADVPKTLKVLAIGNSFSVDAMEYLYQIAKNAGVETVILGNLRVSGCTIDMHMDYAENNTAAYTYLKNTTGTWISTDGYKFIDGLQDEDWDFITFQQASQLSGMQNSYNKFNKLVKFVNNNKTNPDAQFLWHMTWAYQQDSTHSGFANYDRSQQTMYQKIVETVQEVVLENDRIVNIIPSGTAVQNARTSFMGDTLTRDGYHMYQPMGRYLVGLTYFAALTGADISGITYAPSSTASPELIAMFKESVINAMNNKFEVTNSTYTEGTAEIKPAQKTDAEIAQAAGVDLSKYTKLEFEYVENKYWYCTQATAAPNNASSSQDGKFVCSKERFTKDQLLGALIICDDGWRFRAEKWPNATDKAASRGVNIQDVATVLNASWWGTDTYLAINISKVSGEKISSDYAGAATHVRIYVPNEKPDGEDPTPTPKPNDPTAPVPNSTVAQADAALAQTLGIDLSKYEFVEFTYLTNSYYNCTTGIAAGASSSSQNGKFICTKERFTKEQLMNAIIICDEGWQYRPEKWPNATDKATSRGTNTTTSIVLMNETWWGNDTYAAFNISKTSGKIEDNYAEAALHVRIYVLIEATAQ